MFLGSETKRKPFRRIEAAKSSPLMRKEQAEVTGAKAKQIGTTRGEKLYILWGCLKRKLHPSSFHSGGNSRYVFRRCGNKKTCGGKQEKEARNENIQTEEGRTASENDSPHVNLKKKRSQG